MRKLGEKFKMGAFEWVACRVTDLNGRRVYFSDGIVVAFFDLGVEGVDELGKAVTLPPDYEIPPDAIKTDDPLLGPIGR